MEENVTTIEQPKKRPTFLTVLCILSFIGSGGFGLLMQLYNYATFESSYPTKVEQLTTALETLEGADMEESFWYGFYDNQLFVLEKTSQDLELITGVNCLFALLSLIGVFMMFKLRKNGFYLYTGSNLFWLLVPLALIDFNAMLTWTIFGAVITAIFVIMYAVNLKHME